MLPAEHRLASTMAKSAMTRTLGHRTIHTAVLITITHGYEFHHKKILH